MDLKIKLGAAQEVDFAEFLDQTNSGIKCSEWINLLLGKPTTAIPQEFLDQYEMCENSWRDLFDTIRRQAIEWVAPKLKGWGGREQVAYSEEFLQRIGFKLIKNGFYWYWTV